MEGALDAGEFDRRRRGVVASCADSGRLWPMGSPVIHVAVSGSRISVVYGHRETAKIAKIAGTAASVKFLRSLSPRERLKGK